MTAAWEIQRLTLSDADADAIVPGGFTTFLASTSLTVQVRDAHGDLAAHLCLSVGAARALHGVLAGMLEEDVDPGARDAERALALRVAS